MLQLLREWPPGFGGVERVAHCLAEELGGTVFTLRREPGLGVKGDATLSVTYRRCWLPGLLLGRLLLPMPSIALVRLLLNSDPLLVHLPCPTVLMLLWLARLCRPQRQIWVYWHAFLAPRSGLAGQLEGLYQHLALRLIRSFEVITTSPQLQQALQVEGVQVAQLHCLPCSLPRMVEIQCASLWSHRENHHLPSGCVISISRLESYKRIDWLIEAVAAAPAVRELHVIGDGPDRKSLIALAHQRLASHQRVVFHGRLSEAAKLKQLSLADVLVLASDRCNEAFGIVQLEAMACGVPAVAFDLPRSGMYWVSQLPSIPWSGQPDDLAAHLQHLLSSSAIQKETSRQARQRFVNQFALNIWRNKLNQIIHSGCSINAL